MRMQRPIILTAKHRMYGDTFDMSQTHQHAYELVQPLQAGRITFVADESKYVNNLSYTERTADDRINVLSWNTLVWILILPVAGIAIYMSGLLADQTAFNDVYLTQFKHDITQGGYSLQYAGKLKPFPYIIASLLCFSSSTIFGWLSNEDIKLNMAMSVVVALFIAVLQAWAIGVHCTVLPDFKADQLMLSVGSILFLHIAACAITVCIWIRQFFFVNTDVQNDTEKTCSLFWMTVAEDLNSIVCYVLAVTAFNGMASVHDDTTVYFDVVCIVTIGFLQHIANVLMIFHRHVLLNKTKDANENDESRKIVNVIGRSRLLIFLIIGVVVVFCYLRISPTYEAFTLGIPYEILRVLAIITMVSINTLHSIWYEVRYADGTKAWESSPTWKLVTAAFIALLFSIFVVTNARFELSNADKVSLDVKS
jgi:hypothetical protein